MPGALVLGGGSVKGAFQAGVIAEVLRRGFVPDAIYGVSVGALNGAFLASRAGAAKASGAAPDWPALGEQLVRFWRDNVTGSRSLGDQYHWTTIGWDIGWNTFDSLMDTTKLRDLIRRSVNPEHLRQNAVRFFAGVVNINNGEYIDAGTDRQQLIDYIIASAAIPIVMPAVHVGGALLLDGGLRNVAPLGKAVRDGAERIVLVLCQPEKMNAVNLKKGSLSSLAERVTDIMSNEIVNNDISITEQINAFCSMRKRRNTREKFWKEKRFVEFAVIRPEKELEIDLADFDRREIADLIDLGVKQGSSALFPWEPKPRHAVARRRKQNSSG